MAGPKPDGDENETKRDIASTSSDDSTMWWSLPGPCFWVQQNEQRGAVGGTGHAFNTIRALKLSAPRLRRWPDAAYASEERGTLARSTGPMAL